MEDRQKEILEFAEIAEGIYKNKYGVDLKEIYYSETSKLLRAKHSNVQANKEDHYEYLNEDGKKVYSLRNKFRIQKSFSKNKFAEILSGKHLILVPEKGEEKCLKQILAHELAHSGFGEIWEMPYGNYGAFKIARTINEGVAMNAEAHPDFKKYYQTEFLESLAKFEVQYEKYLPGSIRKWEREEKIDFANDRCFYILGYRFIKNIWNLEKQNFRDLVTMLKENTPTEKEILNPGMYQARMGI